MKDNISSSQTEKIFWDGELETNESAMLAVVPSSNIKEVSGKKESGCVQDKGEEQWINISPALLISLKLGRDEGEKVNVLCACSAVHANGLRLTLPCHLNMMPDDILSMEIFLPTTAQPIPVTAIISAIRASNTDDSIFYEIDTEFRQLSVSVKNEIRAFLSDRTNFKRKSLPA